MEQFSIPGVGGIIVQLINDVECVLLQERWKADAPDENGLLEIPAGKIRAFENIFDALRREISEETGLEVVEIVGENMTTIYDMGKYKVINYTPFSNSQNISGDYPIMVFVFICYVKGNLLKSSDEAKNYRWIPTNEVAKMLEDNPKKFYPMHIDTLKKYILTYQN